MGDIMESYYVAYEKTTMEGRNYLCYECAVEFMNNFREIVHWRNLRVWIQLLRLIIL